MYNVWFEVAGTGFVAILLFYIYYEYPTASESTKRFRKMIAWLLISEILDVVTAIMIDYGAYVPPALNIFANTLFFLSSAQMGLRFVLYLSSWIGGYRKNLFYYACTSIYAVYLVLMLANIPFGFVFTFNAAGEYIHGTFYFLCHSMVAVMSLIGIFYIYYHRRDVEKRQRMAVWIFLVLFAAGALLQIIFFPKTILVMYWASLASMVFLFVIETPDFQKLEKTMAELDAARKQADETNAAKSKFLAKMSHEIRTPINAVIGMNEMILRTEKDEEIRGYAFDIKRSAETLLSTINDILDLSKVESGKMELVPVDYDVSSLLHDVVNMISLKARDKGLSVRLSLDEKLPSRLFGDDVRLRQILLNLLNNAVKYTDEGFVSLAVSVLKGDADGIAKLRFAVSDSGIGIKEEDREKLFSEYARLDTERNRNVEGTGLGMHITVQLLTLMDSHLEVDSTYGEGSTFSFTISQPIINAEPIGNLETRISEQVNEFSYAASFVAPEATILLVDDNATNRRVCRALLSETRVQIDEAAGGYECLECVKEKHYDVILLDDMMPDLDGMETLRRMKADADNRSADTPVVALTANAVAGAKEMYEEAGFDAFLAKPIRPEKLEGLLAELLPRELLRLRSEEADVSDGAMRRGRAETVDGATRELSAGGNAEQFSEFPEIDGVDFDYAMRHLHDANLLWTTILDFISTADSEYRKADALFENAMNVRNENHEPLRQYRVFIHAEKNSAAMIGALTVSSLAKVLEYAARDEDYETLERVHPVFQREWKKLTGDLQIAFGGGVTGEIHGRKTDDADDEGETATAEAASANNRPQIDAEMLTEFFRLLRAAVADVDVDTADNIMEELQSFAYPAEISPLLEDLSLAVKNIDEKEVNRITAEIIEIE